MTELLPTLTALNKITAHIAQVSKQKELSTTLQLVVDSLVELLTIELDHPTAILWLYDEAIHHIDPTVWVTAGTLTIPPDELLPRTNGLGQRAIEQRRQVLSYQEYREAIHPVLHAAGVRAVACTPLLMETKVVGLLYLYRSTPTHFEETVLLMLQHFGQLASMAIYWQREMGGRTKTLARRVDELEKLGLVSKRINNRATLDETLREILSISLEMLAAQYGSIELYDKKNHQLVMRALAGTQQQDNPENALLLSQNTVVCWVAINKRSLLITDLQHHPWDDMYLPLPVNRPMRSELAVPLIGAGEELEGVINIESPHPNAFNHNDQRMLETIATQVVAALQEIRLLDALHEIFNVLLMADPEKLFRLIIDWACDLINVPAGSIWLIVDEVTLVVSQSTAGYQRGDKLPLHGSLTEQAMRLQQPIIIDDLRVHPAFINRPAVGEQGWVSVIVVPLLLPGQGRSLGSFSFFSATLRDFTNWDKRVLTCLANHAAIAIQETERMTQLKEAQERQAIAETFAAVGDVAANLMHQLNNKVGAIPAKVQAIEAKSEVVLRNNPYLAKNLRDIEKSAKRALNIVRDSMTHLRPTERHPLIVADCLEQAIERANPKSHIRIKRINLGNLPRVIANDQQLEMVFYNLIDNALKAMKEQRKGALNVEGAVLPYEVQITVADTGPGIPLEHQAHIFEFRPSLDYRLGFGLWWVKTFVDRFGGRIFFESQVGRGSSFTICLPREVAHG